MGWEMETRNDVRDGCLWEEVGEERKNRGGGEKKLLSVDFFSRR